jgi:quinol monooxygenase YgiN
MIVYEVSLAVDADAAEAYAEWLAEHLREMLALPGFEGAEWLEDVTPDPPDDRRRWVVQYRLASETALDAYLRDHAPRMREDGLARFGGRFAASRRVLRPPAR